MRAWPSFVSRRLVPVVLAFGVSSAGQAQTAISTAGQALPMRISMDDAVRLALEHNHELRAQRLNVDASKADEVTAALKPNPVLTSTNENFPVFSPSQLTWDNLANNQNLRRVAQLSVRARRQARQAHGGRPGHHGVTAKTTADAERQLAFQAAAGVHRRAARAVDAGPGARESSELFKCRRRESRAHDGRRPGRGRLLQDLAPETAVRAGRLVGGGRARCRRRRRCARTSGPTRWPRTSTSRASSPTPSTRRRSTMSEQAALAARPDLLAAQSGVKLAEDTQALALGNRARDIVGEVEYDRAGTVERPRLRHVDRAAVSRSQSGQHRAEPGRGPAGVGKRVCRPGPLC